MDNKRYNKLFDSDAAKARAFDKIAEVYYDKNFSTMQKSDFDVLMFSIYIEQILDKSEDDFVSYSDYELSKELGITQSRVSILKQKKELKYPRAGFSWQKAFSKCAEKARYENGKIQLYIPDRNLYLEIKNAVEKEWGIVDIKRNASVLQLSPEDFVKLIIAAGEENKEEIKKAFIKQMHKSADKDKEMIEQIENAPFEKSLGAYAKKYGVDILCDLLKAITPINIPGYIKEPLKEFVKNWASKRRK